MAKRRSLWIARGVAVLLAIVVWLLWLPRLLHPP